MLDDFATLDRGCWLPHYLPHWSSREASAATWQVADSVLELSIPVDQPRWCPETHVEPLRVSGIQSGAFSGQQPFLDGQQVVSEEPLWIGWSPWRERATVRARMDLSPRSMASVWMVGLEDRPERCGEICLFEVFGRTIDAAGADVGAGVHPFRDPSLVDDFAAPHLAVDVTQWHDYAVDWHDDRIELVVDGEVVRTVEQSPDYPMQIIVAVFDFPAWPGPADHVPRLWVDRVETG